MRKQKIDTIVPYLTQEALTLSEMVQYDQEKLYYYPLYLGCNIHYKIKCNYSFR